MLHKLEPEFLLFNGLEMVHLLVDPDFTIACNHDQESLGTQLKVSHFNYLDGADALEDGIELDTQVGGGPTTVFFMVVRLMDAVSQVGKLLVCLRSIETQIELRV